MIYCLVNNDYQLLDLKTHLQHIDEDVALIEISHRMNMAHEDMSWKSVYRFDRGSHHLLDLLNVWRIWKRQRIIDETLDVSQDDILLLYTEFDIFNQYVVRKFKDAGAKVVLLEDGMATNVLFNMEPRPLPMLLKIKQWLINGILGFRDFSYRYMPGIRYPVIADRYIDCICSYTSLKSRRAIKNIVLKKDVMLLSGLDRNKVIFLSQDLYAKEDFSIYMDELYMLFKHLSRVFETVYFKPHPNEQDDFVVKIITKLKPFTNVQFIMEKTPIETMIGQYKPKYVVSMISSALLSLRYVGLEPVFLHRYFSATKMTDTSAVLSRYLEALEYAFVDDIRQITPAYRSNLHFGHSGCLLRDVIGELRDVSGVAGQNMKTESAV